MLCGAPAQALAQSQVDDRQRAIQALASPDTGMRRAAATRLGEVGASADAAALVQALRDVDEETRGNAEAALWRIWARSGNPDVDKLYQAGVDEMSAGMLEQSIATFTRIIALAPDFAEGWNKRATAYFLAGDLH